MLILYCYTQSWSKQAQSEPLHTINHVWAAMLAADAWDSLSSGWMVQNWCRRLQACGISTQRVVVELSCIDGRSYKLALENSAVARFRRFMHTAKVTPGAPAPSPPPQ